MESPEQPGSSGSAQHPKPEPALGANGLSLALQHHQAGRLAEAEGIYKQLLQQDPTNVHALHLLGVLANQVGRADIAAGLIGQAIQLNPTVPAFHANLGVALLMQHRPELAADSLRRALALDPTSYEALANLGTALMEQGKVEEAVATFQRVIALRPDSAVAHTNLGNSFLAARRLEEAVASLRHAVSLDPASAEAHTNLGVALKKQGYLDQAVASLQRAITLDPHSSVAHANLGDAYFDQKNLEGAAASFQRALAIRPDYGEAHLNLGLTFHALGRLEEAVASFERALALDPASYEAHTNLGTALLDLGRHDESVAEFRRAVALRPDVCEAHVNLGFVLRCLGQLDEAARTFHTALSIDPDDADAHVGLALTHLTAGDLSPGWAEYEWRWRWKQFTTPRWNSSQPEWDGGDLDGKTILVHAEQGYGDTIQFVRFLPGVAARGGKVLLACQPALAPLLSEVEGAERVVITEQDLPDYALHAPLMSLPYLLEAGGAGRLVEEALHRKRPYLHADEGLVAQWRQELAPYRGLRVGLVWAGSPTNSNDRNRSTTLVTLGALGQAGVHFFALQKGEAGKEALTLPEGMDLIDLGPRLAGFADTAAVLAQLDVVISVDTAVAHLAGAMGVPVWVLLSSVADWRWHLHREDSPWYPSARLFRQDRPGEWAPLLQRVATALHALRAGRQS